jgi:membrane-associated phospholipid phosphatase
MPIRARWALGFAGACSALLGLLWLAAFHVGFVERADHKVFVAFYNLTYLYYRHRIYATATSIVSLCDPSSIVYLAALPVGIALARRRPYDACAVVVLLGGASVATLVLKHLLPEPGVVSFLGVTSPVPYPRFPSGHSTAAMSLVLALTLVVPARIRPLVAGLGAVFAAAVGYSVLALGTHFPSDVFAGFLVAATWALLTAAALLALDGRVGRAWEPSRPVSFREALTPPIAALLAAAVLATIVLLINPHAVVSYVRANTAFIVGAAVIAAFSTAVATGVLLSLRRDVQR